MVARCHISGPDRANGASRALESATWNGKRTRQALVLAAPTRAAAIVTWVVLAETVVQFIVIDVIELLKVTDGAS